MRYVGYLLDESERPAIEAEAARLGVVVSRWYVETDPGGDSLPPVYYDMVSQAGDWEWMSQTEAESEAGDAGRFSSQEGDAEGSLLPTIHAVVLTSSWRNLASTREGFAHDALMMLNGGGIVLAPLDAIIRSPQTVPVDDSGAGFNERVYFSQASMDPGYRPLTDEDGSRYSRVTEALQA